MSRRRKSNPTGLSGRGAGAEVWRLQHHYHNTEINSIQESLLAMRLHRCKVAFVGLTQEDTQTKITRYQPTNLPTHKKTTHTRRREND